MKFTEKKFSSLPREQQHKKCMELMREMYLQMLSWMNLHTLASPSSQNDVADRFHLHRVAAQVSLKEHNLLPQVHKGDTPSNAAFLPISIYLDRLRSAHNIGAIIRTTEAFRLGALYFSPGMAAPTHESVQKSAMHTAPLVSCHENVALESLPRPIIAVETVPDATPYYDFDFPEQFTLVLGNEEEGISDHSLQLADFIIKIPLQGQKNSINVASAFAIIAAEIRKKRAL